MSRYIDYDAIDYRNDKMHDKSSDFIDGVIYMAQRIEEAPSIDIVHCRECTYRDNRKKCPMRVFTGDNGFCCCGADDERSRR